jgi:hypothetical protein
MRLNRNDLKGLNNTTFTTNNNKEITATKQRAYNESDIDSFFNLEDDELKNLTFDNNTGETLNDKFNDVNPIILSGAVVVGDVGGGSFGTVPVLQLGNNTSFTSATKTNNISGDNSTIVTVNFANIGTTDYLVLVNLIGSGGQDNDNSLRTPIIRDKSATSFKIDIEEANSGGQSIKYEIALIRL